MMRKYFSPIRLSVSRQEWTSRPSSTSSPSGPTLRGETSLSRTNAGRRRYETHSEEPCAAHISLDLIKHKSSLFGDYGCFFRRVRMTSHWLTRLDRAWRTWFHLIGDAQWLQRYQIWQQYMPRKSRVCPNLPSAEWSHKPLQHFNRLILHHSPFHSHWMSTHVHRRQIWLYNYQHGAFVFLYSCCLSARPARPHLLTEASVSSVPLSCSECFLVGPNLRLLARTFYIS